MREMLKQKIISNELALGSWITIGHPSIPEIMSYARFDFLVVDMEHSVIGIQELQNMIRAIELHNISPLVRLTSNEEGLIARCMDAGVCGIIVPQVNNKSDAIKAVEATKYPPTGKRSVGLARAQGYGFKFKEYMEKINKNSIVLVQIEHKDAIYNIEEILSTEGVDGYILGPYDLSASMNKSCQDIDYGKIENIERKVVSIAQKHKKISGYHIVHPDKKIIKNKIAMGYKFLALGADNVLLGQKCIDIMKTIRNIQKKRRF